ncbi:MAG: aldo/keto reductase [Clostridia bacterium]|nr:aldo/keto reductase [Clostridia bacterium]
MSFEKIKKNFGFGCMRLKMDGDSVDMEEFTKMVDYFMQNGFNYFDTAHGYLDGKSEIAIKQGLSDRYPRESFVLTNKLSPWLVEKQEDIKPYILNQLSLCGVEYFDFYLMHSQNKEFYQKFKNIKAYETAFELKKEGLIKHVGLSFHDTADVLDMILTENPQIEVVQIQFNYLDFDDPVNQSKLCYDVCRKHNKPILIMEPIKGGRLVNLSPKASKIFDDLGGGSYASYALRFAGSFDGVLMILSGMGNMDMMKDNLSFMKDFKRLSDKEFSAVSKVTEILKKENLISCTNCRYCVDGCPSQIKIPDLFSIYNNMVKTETLNVNEYDEFTLNTGKASSCVKCGGCEEVCPQRLPIKKLISKLAWIYEKK